MSPPRRSLANNVSLILVLSALTAASAATVPPLPVWKHLSSRDGTLPQPNGGKQQTAAIVFDIDGDGADDIVIGERTRAPALVWIQHTDAGWKKHVIDNTRERPEAGGVAFDVDGDGDKDLIIGGDSMVDELWWYENPRPDSDPAAGPWRRHLIKKGLGGQHHDQAVADFLGTGRPQVMFWNQNVHKLLLAEIPQGPRSAGLWPLEEILDTSSNKTATKQEGMDVADIDGDGTPDLVAGIFWFKHLEGRRFKPVQVAPEPGRVAVGRFKKSVVPQIVLAPGDGSGPLLLIECDGDPLDPASWKSRDLLGVRVVHGHSLQVADINEDGNEDIFCAEMGKWTEKRSDPDNPSARAWILYGDGAGNFTTTVFSTGIGFHEARVADVNGDGRPDIIDKPYNWETPCLEVWLNEGNTPPVRP